MRLAYQSGAVSVRCAVRHRERRRRRARALPVRRLRPRRLAYAGDAQFVRCAACEHVTRVGGGENREENRSAPHAPSPFGGGAGRASAMVVVENPPTLDHAGTPRSNMAVGVVSED